MSLRRSLVLFFVAIVAVPLIAVGIFALRVSEDSRDGKSDATLAAGLDTARMIYDRSLRAALDQAERLGRLGGVAPALRDADADALEQIARRETSGPSIAAIEFRGTDGSTLGFQGADDALAFGDTVLSTADAERLGRIRVSNLTATDFVRSIESLTGRDAAVVRSEQVLAGTRDLGDLEVPQPSTSTTVTLTDGDYRAASLALDGAAPGTRLVLLVPEAQGFVASEPLVASILVVFFAVAIWFILSLLGNLRRRIAIMLSAARRIGDGDFEGRVPVDGNDEMAELAREFNKMSDRLGDQVAELRRQRSELEQSVKRIGEAFASGLDRRALLETVIETAEGACAAEQARAVLRDSPGPSQVIDRDRAAPAELGELLDLAGKRALEASGQGVAEAGGAHAIAHAMIDRRDSGKVLCTVAVARHGEPFSAQEQEVLRYLVGQTAVSIENIGLHERVAKQAVTDELTGLSNHRRFNEWINREASRHHRFGGEFSLVILDIDDFKEVNDTHGHLQGDAVLEELGRLLKLESRGIDEPARYGGEEFVLGLPETDKEGALEVAERLRRRIEMMSVPGVGRSGPIAVTASLGVASMPTDAATTRALIATADDALYRAKREGKNRVEAAAAAAAPLVPQGNAPQRRS